MIARSRIYRQITTRTVSHYSAKGSTHPTPAYHDKNVHGRQFSSGRKHGAKNPIYSVPHFSNMNFEMVLVRVGKPADAVDIMVYRHLICSVSTFFRGAIDRSFLGVKEGTITLRDVSEATFRTFLAWLHSQYLPASPPEPLLGYPNGSKLFTNTNGDGVNSGAKPTGRGRPRKRIFDEYVSGKSPVLRILGPEELDRRFHSNPAWQKTYQEVVKALVRLYIFADRYSIPQLRDDVMSTYVGYCISFGLYPDPDDVEVIDLAYKKLPATAMLSRYLVLSTIYFWTPVKPTLESGKLKQLHPGFTLDVMTAQAQRGQPPEEGETDATKTVPQLAKHGLKNSCVFHEHQVFDEDTCRRRLTNSKFIFDGILDACMKEAKTVVGRAS